MRCTSCQTYNPPENRFCEQCGTPLEVHCPQCGVTVRPGARFYGAYGYRLLEPEAVAQASASRLLMAATEYHSRFRYEDAHPIGSWERFSQFAMSIPESKQPFGALQKLRQFLQSPTLCPQR